MSRSSRSRFSSRTRLAWLPVGAFTCSAAAACNGPLLDADDGALFGDRAGAGGSGAGRAGAGQLSPGAGGGGFGGFPAIPLPGGASGGAAGIAQPVPPGSGSGMGEPAETEPPAGEEPGTLLAITSQQRLIAFEAASGAVTRELALTGLAAGEELLGADYRPADRQLYALGRSGALYRIDTASGAAVVQASLAADPADSSAAFAALEGSDFAVDFNPVVDRLRVVSDSGQNLRIHPDTGRVTTDGAVASPASVSAVAYTNAFGAACRTRLYGIDAGGQQLVVVDPPNDGKLAPVGALVASGLPRAFDVFSAEDGTQAALAVLESAGVSALYDVDLASGALSKPRTLALAAGESLRGAARAPARSAPVQAPGELIGVTESGRLVSFQRTAPGKLCTALPLAGLTAEERVLGVDVRPADGSLYALGSAGRIYALDPASGQATLRSILAADPTDASEPFAALPEGALGIGFNPVPDRLRVISASGQNLRVNVDTGATFTDGPLPAQSSLSALGYANAFAGAKTTTLFALDTRAGTLVRVGGDPASGGACPADAGNPNCGVPAPLGSLGRAPLTALAGFDIDAKSGAAGAALLALNEQGSASSSLFVLDLASGATALPAGLAQSTIGGGERLASLTLASQPVVSVYALLSDWRLVSFAPSSPERFDSGVEVIGIDPDEGLLGMDFRASDGRLYAVASSGKVYTIDLSTGSATLAFGLSAAAADDDPFLGFDARASHGVDVNPVADLLRVASEFGQNLRIVPSARSLGTPALEQRAGATFSDLELGPDFPAVVASAYTSNYAGATRTTLFGIDAESDLLVRQGGPDSNPSPNTGVLTSIGALGLDAVGNVSFDIAGGRDGIALAALETPETPASLYSISLATGAATPFNAAGNNRIGDGSARVTGLAIQIRAN